MEQYIGITSWTPVKSQLAFSMFDKSDNIINELKRNLLFFDRILIPEVNENIEIVKKNIKDFTKHNLNIEYIINELEWLVEHELVFESNFLYEKDLKKIHDDAPDFEKEDILYATGLAFVANKFLLNLPKHIKEKNYDYAVKDIIFKNEYFARALSFFLNREPGKFTVPLLSELSSLDFLKKTKKSEIVRIILDDFPIPDELTPWEEILQFKSKHDIKHQYLGFRVFLSELAQSKLSLNEIEEKIIFMLNEYKDQLKLHNLKTRLTKIESSFLVVPEFLENIIRLKFGAAAKSLLKIEHNKIITIESETSLKGREVAYMVSAKHHFTS